MENLILYMVKASIALALFYGLYLLCFRNDTFFRLRRFYFLFAVFFSLAFPLVMIEMPVDYRIQAQLPAYIFSNVQADEVIVSPSESESVNLWIVVLGCLLVISLLQAIQFILQLASIMRLRIKNKSDRFDFYKIVKIENKDISPFSFYKWIFINSEALNKKDINGIIAHELVHIRQYHFIDVMLFEVLSICFWWNPFVWLLKKEMKINLEYLADEGVLKEGFDCKEYQYALLQVSNKNTGIPIINHFNVSQLKKRITMMNKGKTSIKKTVKYLFIVPVAAALLLGNAVQASPDYFPEDQQESQNNTVTVTFQADPLPEFPGGSDEMMKFVATNLKYPVEAQEKGTQGEVIVKFVVKSTGEIADVKITKKVDPLLDAEVIRIVKLMPKWVPAKKGGKAVNAEFSFPVNFRLIGHEKTNSSSSDDPNQVVVVGYGNKKDDGK